MQEKNPTVFISYSHDSKKHQDRVLKLANKFRSEGIDCILDQYEDSPAEGWPKWMDRGVKNSDYVLVVCTETYYNRVMGDDEKGLGIKWESTLIYQQLYNAGANNTKFIPIIFADGKFEYIPEPLQGATFYNVEDEVAFDKLYWRLRGVKASKPKLGKLRSLPVKERKTIFVSDLINQNNWDKANWKNGVGFLLSENNLAPPILVLLFETMKQGQDLFSSLIDKIGRNDSHERLRISIVQGEVPSQDNGYFVVIGENAEVTDKIFSDKVDINYFFINQRFHRIYLKQESLFLAKFKEGFNKSKSFYIAPGIQINNANGSTSIEFDLNYSIFKHEIQFREYKDIPDKNDPDSILKSKEIREHKF